MNVKSNLSSMYGKMVDRCVCCGEIIPEGRQVCPACESKVRSDRLLADLKKLLTFKARDEWDRLSFCLNAYGSNAAETRRARANWATCDNVLRMLEDPELIAEELKFYEEDD